MKKKNLFLVALSLCLVAVIAVGATLAYFTDTTSSRTNTFTAGSVDIGIVDESPEGPVDPEKPDGEQLVTGTPTQDPEGNNTGIEYDNVLPGDIISKKVAVTVLEGSEESWVALRVKVEASNEAVISDIWASIDAQVDTALWEKSALSADGYATYYFKETTPESTSRELFNRLALSAQWNSELVAGLNMKIIVEAGAVQAKNVDFATAKAEIDGLFTA